MSHFALKLVHKTELISKVYFLVFQSENDFEYNPGQFFSLEVEPKLFRAYSICYVGKKAPQFENIDLNLEDLDQGNYICFMISTKPGGEASHFFTEAKVGLELNGIGPNGRFALKENYNPKVFVATGTGLAPFVGMISQVLDQKPTASVDLFFGCWHLGDNFSPRFFQKYLNNSNYPNFRLFVVAEDLGDTPPSDRLFNGRVTTVVPEVLGNLENKDFYLCGHPMMVSSMEEVLVGLNVSKDNLIMEKFGK